MKIAKIAFEHAKHVKMDLFVKLAELQILLEAEALVIALLHIMIMELMINVNNVYSLA